MSYFRGSGRSVNHLGQLTLFQIPACNPNLQPTNCNLQPATCDLQSETCKYTPRFNFPLFSIIISGPALITGRLMEVQLYVCLSHDYDYLFH